MGVQFCEMCNKLLVPSFANDKLTFTCELCILSYESKPEDTLRSSRFKESNIMVFQKILDKAVDDPATIKARVKCLNKKCSGEIVKQVRIGEDMRLYNICTTCKLQWLSN